MVDQPIKRPRAISTRSVSEGFTAWAFQSRVGSTVAAILMELMDPGVGGAAVRMYFRSANRSEERAAGRIPVIVHDLLTAL